MNPVPKNSAGDPLEPLSYRGITLSSSSYKAYSGVLNNRLTRHTDLHDLLCDEQNGFRKGRSTMEHISTVTSIVETRKSMGKDTFVAFIDLKKAYDCIDWDKHAKIGITRHIPCDCILV